MSSLSCVLQAIVDEQAAQLNEKQQKQVHTFHCITCFFRVIFYYCCDLDTWEEEDSTAHFIAQCTALMLLRKNILGEYILSLDTLCSIHWILLLKFAKASKRFYWPCSLSGLRMLWPQRWVPAHAATHPACKAVSHTQAECLESNQLNLNWPAVKSTDWNISTVK